MSPTTPNVDVECNHYFDTRSNRLHNGPCAALQIFTVVEAPQRLPFGVEEASRPEADYEKEDAQFARVGLDTRLDNRVMDLRVSSRLGKSDKQDSGADVPLRST